MNHSATSGSNSFQRLAGHMCPFIIAPRNPAGIMEFMRARALYVAFDVFPRPKGSSSHIASMVAALAKEFAPVCVLCLGDGELPLYQADGAVEIHRLPSTHRDVLHRATALPVCGIPRAAAGGVPGAGG